jgi:cell division ATPase FtsA
MIRVAGEEVHYYKENELGDQLCNTALEIWGKAHGLSATAKLIEHAIYDAEMNAGQAVSKSDISYAVGMLSDYASIIASSISNINEVLRKDDVTKALNKFDADQKVFSYEFRYRPLTYSEQQAKEKTA